MLQTFHWIVLVITCKHAGLMSKHADVTLTHGGEVSSQLSLFNVVMAAHFRPMKTMVGCFV